MLSPTDLNRIKIRDLMAAIKADIDPESPMGLLKLKFLDQREEDALEKGDEAALHKIEQFFIEEKLEVEYYPSQNRKVVKGKVVPIDQIYG